MEQSQELTDNQTVPVVAANRPRLLLVDSSRIMQLLLGKQLIRRGYDILTCQSVPEALGLLGEKVISLVMVEMEMPDINGLDFLLWLKANRPELPAVLLLANLSEEMRRFLRQQEVLYFDKSWQLETLFSLIEPKLRKRGLDITAQDLMLFELMQLCVLSGRQRCIRLTEPVTGEQGTLWFAQNRVIHASMNEHQGEAALIQMMRLAKGTFQEVPWETVEAETISRPFDSLMMGIATQIDEERHAAGDSAADDSGQNLRSLLVVSWNAQQRIALEQHFRGCGFKAQGLTRAQEALDWLDFHPCDLLVSDLQSADMQPQVFLDQVHARRPQTKVILLVDELSVQTAQLARQWGAASCYQKPVMLGELEALVRYLFSPHSFSGKLWNMSLMDFLQIVSFGNSSKTFRLHDLSKETQGLLYFQGGNVIHAELGHLKGEAAFQGMLGIQRGLLSEAAQAPSPEQSIEIPLTRLLMRAMSAVELPTAMPETDHALPFATSAALPGISLKELLKENTRMTLGEGLEMLVQLSSVLDQSHARGLIFRDLRPEHIKILPDNLIKITDASGQELENYNDRHFQQGTVAYISPEQLYHPENASAQSDQFSFGVIMYEIFTRELPFLGENTGATIMQIMGEAAESPRSLNSRLPESIELIVLRCLEKDPANRFESCSQLAEVLLGSMLSLEKPILEQPLRADAQRRLSDQQKAMRTTRDIKLRQTLHISATHRLKILHVEDDPIRLQMMLDFISESGLNYDCVQTGYVAEALQLLSRQEFDFIICDYILKDGMADSILEMAQGTPLVVVSSLNQPETIIKLMKKGALDFIIKANAMDEFRQIVTLIQKKSERLKQLEKLDTMPGLQQPTDLAAMIASQVQAAVAPGPVAAPVFTPLNNLEMIFQKVIGKQGAAPGEFASPRWLHFCPYRRNLLVADTQNSRIQILSLTGDVIRIVQHPEMVAPCAVTRSADGRIYVLDAADAKLRIFSPEGNLNQVAGGKPTFKSAFGLALLDSQDLVVTDPEGHCIHMLNPNGQLRDSISQDFKSPSGIIAINQQIYILDFGLPAVFRLNNAGQVVGRFGKRGTGKGDFSVPKGITVNEFGHIFVAEALSHRIQVFDAQGTWVTSFGKKGTGEGEFSNPESLACRPGGLIYVLDRGNHRIQVFKYLTS